MGLALTSVAAVAAMPAASRAPIACRSRDSPWAAANFRSGSRWLCRPLLCFPTSLSGRGGGADQSSAVPPRFCRS